MGHWILALRKNLDLLEQRVYDTPGGGEFWLDQLGQRACEKDSIAQKIPELDLRIGRGYCAVCVPAL